MQPPELLEIDTPRNLLAGGLLGMPIDSTITAPLETEAQGLLDYAQTLIEGEELMFIMDVPSVPPQDTPIVLAQAGSTANAPPQPDYILYNCQETEHTEYDPRSALRGIDPAAALRGYFIDRDNKLIDLELFKPSLLQGARHGKISTETDNLGLQFYGYDPEPGFYGDDQAVFMVEFEGKRYKLIYQIRVMEYIPDDTTCPPPKLIKVKKPAKPSSGVNGYDLNSITVTFADLEGAAIGQTTGTTTTLSPSPVISSLSPWERVGVRGGRGEFRLVRLF